jgi:hypothetical protein
LALEYGVFYIFYIQKEQIAEAKNDHATRKSPGNILCYRALPLILCKEHTPKLYKNESATESDKWCLNGWLSNMALFYTIYIQKEQIAGPKNDHASRKSPGNIFWIRAFVFILCKEHPQKLYKNEFATESDECCFNGCL